MAEAVTSEDPPSGEVLLLNSLYALDTLGRPNELEVCRLRAALRL